MTTLLVDVQCLQGDDPERGIPRWTVEFVRALRRRGLHVVGLTNDRLNPVHPIFIDAFDNVVQNSRADLRAITSGVEVVYLCPSMFEPVRPIRSLLPSHVVESGIAITTIAHDLTNYLFPAYYQVRRGDDRLFEARRRLFACADLHFAISRSTARDLVKTWSVPERRVINVGSGISGFFAPQIPHDGFLQGLGISMPFVLCVGRADPRKRTMAAIESFARLPNDLRDRLQLVIACKVGQSTQAEWRHHAQTLGVSDASFVITGLVTDEELRFLYSACSLFVEPSEYEGFGFPASEAAACGAPVIVARNSSLVEILECDEATFETHSTQALATHIERGLTDDEFRSRLLAAGASVRRRHDWDLVAERAIDPIKRLARRVTIPRRECDVPESALGRTFLEAEFDSKDHFPVALLREPELTESRRLRVGVYDRFWATMGGGEQHAGATALALASKYDVELIGIEDFDRSKFAKILGRPAAADLPLRIIGHEPSAVARASADYDLFVNHSYTSEDFSLARHSLYVVFFPQRYHSPGRRKYANVRFTISDAWYVSPGIRDEIVLRARRPMIVTTGRPDALTFIAEGDPGLLVVNSPGGEAEEIVLNGKPQLVSLKLAEGRSTLEFRGSADSQLRIGSPQTGSGHRIYLPQDITTGVPAFIRSYNRVLGNSMYTSHWIAERWGCAALTHYPPVELRDPAAGKERIILSVGRFFAEESGHCKQQLRLVEAFKRMVHDGLSGWRLVLIGAADSAHRDYALEVRRAAAGEPIDVLLNADFNTLNEQLKCASIYWHATGLGADLREYPERAEHFGISVVEAMSTGAIPVVFSTGGPVEVVEHGVSGFHFSSIDELITLTREIIDAPREKRETLRRASAKRARNFSTERFSSELLFHVDEILAMKDENHAY